MYYFDEVTFTTNVMRKKDCVDNISLFSVFSYSACAIDIMGIYLILAHLYIYDKLSSICQLKRC